MKAAIFAYSRKGCETARRVMGALGDAQVRAYAPARFAREDFLPLPQPTLSFYGEAFSQSDALIFVGSCGIAVRSIAPYVRDKRTDPAVVCIDELGGHVIPLLSGHIGGANALARRLSAALGAEAVITTATDVNRRFSVDTWASEQGFLIADMARVKAVSAMILEQDVPLCSDFPIVTDYPTGVTAGDSGAVGICISCHEKSPFDRTLRLVPRALHVGIGCRKGTAKEKIAALVDAVFRENALDKRAVKCVASIDLKSEEAGLLSYCAAQNWPIDFYAAERLLAVEGSFTPSAFVQRVTGVENVCERAAMVGAERLLVRKTAKDGVTVAVAAEKVEVRFG